MLSAPIDRVRVYSRGASITRVLTLSNPLPEVLEVSGLPLSLVDASIRVRSLDDGVITGAVQVGLHAAAPEDTVEPPAESELREVEREIEQLGLRLDLLGVEAELLRGLEVPERPEGEEGKPPPPSPMRARVALEQFTDTAIGERLEEGRALRRKLLQAEEQAAALRDQLARASSARTVQADALTKVVIVDLRGAADTARIEVEYFVPGARWAPQYQCDIAVDGTGASLKLRALVCQASGEDWRNVALELSTADPVSFTELPKLASIRIGKAQPAPSHRGYREPPKGAASLYGDFDRERGSVQRMLPSRARFRLPSFDVEPYTSVRLEVEFVPPDMECAEAVFDEDDFDDEELAPEPVMLSRSAPASTPAPAPPPAAPQRRRRAKMKKRDESGAVEPPEPGFGRGAASGAAPVVFSQLRLPSPSDSQRGRLRRVDASVEYLRLLRRSGLEVPFDTLRAVSEARDQAEAAARQSLPGGAIQVRQAAGHFDYSYRADDRVDVPSDLAFHSIPLGARQAECDVSYVVVPRVDPLVFRVASIRNPTSAPLLPGPAEVYVGGEYVLSTELPVVAPGQRFKLGLGVEQGIRCARNTTFREERAGKNVVAMAELHHEIAIELDNQLGRDIQCEVRERIPQPAPDAEVDVEEVSVRPAWEPWDQLELGDELKGGRRWQVQVPAHGSITLDAHYVVKIYANNELVDGNRREA